MAPTIAPLAFAHGINIPKENNPRVIPPTMPLNESATCKINFKHITLEIYHELMGELFLWLKFDRVITSWRF